MSTNKTINYTARTVCPSLREPSRAEWRTTNLFGGANKKPNYYTGSQRDVTRESQWTTDTHIADSLRQDLPHLTGSASLQDKSVGKQDEGTDTTEQGNQSDTQKERTLTMAKVLDSHHPKIYITEHKYINCGLFECATWK